MSGPERCGGKPGEPGLLDIPDTAAEAQLYDPGLNRCPGCPDCRPCERCGGSGTYLIPYTFQGDPMKAEAPCLACSGTGLADTEPSDE